MIYLLFLNEECLGKNCKKNALKTDMTSLNTYFRDVSFLKKKKIKNYLEYYSFI